MLDDIIVTSSSMDGYKTGVHAAFTHKARVHMTGRGCKAAATAGGQGSESKLQQLDTEY